MEKCAQGAVNAESIKELKEQTKELFGSNAMILMSLSKIEKGIAEIQADMRNEKEHRIRLDKSFSEHISDSPVRLEKLKFEVAKEIDKKIEDTKNHVNFWVGVPSVVIAIIGGLIYFLKEVK